MQKRKKINRLVSNVRGSSRADTAQKTIPYEVMYPDGLLKLPGNRYSRSIKFEDINYQLAAYDDQQSAFQKLKDFYNFCKSF